MKAMHDQPVDALAGELGKRAKQLGLWVVTVESCTGGLLAGALTSVPGSSAWFDRGWVTYSNMAKQTLVGVPEVTLKEQGAVSAAVATAMATGALDQALGAGLALSTTGIAGPGGGTPDKPVGLVWFGFALRTSQGVKMHAEKRIFEGDRREVRHASVRFAMERALLLLNRPLGGTD